MMVGHGRNLRAVGNTDDLVVYGQQGQLFGDSLDRGAADPGIDLVEDEGGDTLLPGKDCLYRQHHP